MEIRLSNTKIFWEYNLKKSLMLSYIVSTGLGLGKHGYKEFVLKGLQEDRVEMFEKNLNYLLEAHSDPEIGALVNEIGIVQAVDNFHCYLAIAGAYVFISNPHLVQRSTDKEVKVSYVTSFATMEEFIEAYSWKLSDKLLQEGTKKIVSTYRKTFDLTLEIEDSVVQKAHEGVLLRNVLVHNWGRANTRYLKHSNSKNTSLGQKVPMPATGELIEIVRAIDCFVKLVDDSFIEKYGVECFSTFVSQYDENRIAEYINRYKSPE